MVIPLYVNNPIEPDLFLMLYYIQFFAEHAIGNIWKRHVYYMCVKSLHSCLTLCITQTLIHHEFLIHGIVKMKE